MGSARSRKGLRAGVIAVLAGGAVLGGAGVAAAQDEWPVPRPDSPVYVFEADHWLTPDNPAYWNPLVNEPRLTSPFGTSTRIVCQGFHGVTTACWQADLEGRPHKLERLPANLPNVTGSSAPGGGVGHFVYPVF
ncbi:hypothetical protein [Rhodococcus sp. CH91]|uniref:hypothetical protein n=1 Tax=Rhodococcus sp. CH91 TaxID=2910256 RepID=UPI001F4B65C9|nr:hypothetical protein [Rhodococcus sp. CH91]